MTAAAGMDIRLPASLVDSPLWEKSPEFLKVYMALVIRAGRVSPPGICPVSMTQVSRDCQLSRQQAHRACKWLMENRYIQMSARTVERTGGLPAATVITICGAKYLYAKPRKSAKTKRTVERTEAKPRPRDAHADAFKAAFDAAFPAPYAWLAGDFVALAKWRKTYPTATPARLVQVARFHWDKGQYTPRSSLSIRGICSDWAGLSAGVTLASGTTSTDGMGAGQHLQGVEL